MGRPENPEISIVVIGWRRAPDLRRCLAALAETVDRHAVEIIVTLNEPAPALLAELANNPDLLDECLVAESNRGYALANNAGAQAARGTYLVLLSMMIPFRNQGGLNPSLNGFPPTKASGRWVRSLLHLRGYCWRRAVG